MNVSDGAPFGPWLPWDRSPGSSTDLIGVTRPNEGVPVGKAFTLIVRLTTREIGLLAWGKSQRPGPPLLTQSIDWAKEANRVYLAVEQCGETLPHIYSSSFKTSFKRCHRQTVPWCEALTYTCMLSFSSKCSERLTTQLFKASLPSSSYRPCAHVSMCPHIDDVRQT